MGFKPLSQLKEQYFLKPASFIYPEEEVYVFVKTLRDRNGPHQKTSHQVQNSLYKYHH